jgi:hypothetical protein
MNPSRCLNSANRSFVFISSMASLHCKSDLCQFYGFYEYGTIDIPYSFSATLWFEAEGNNIAYRFGFHEKFPKQLWQGAAK